MELGRYTNVDIVVGDAITYKTVQVVVYWICLLFIMHIVVENTYSFITSSLHALLTAKFF